MGREHGCPRRLSHGQEMAQSGACTTSAPAPSQPEFDGPRGGSRPLARARRQRCEQIVNVVRVGAIANGHVLTRGRRWVRLNDQAHPVGPWQPGNVVSSQAFTGAGWAGTRIWCKNGCRRT